MKGQKIVLFRMNKGEFSGEKVAKRNWQGFYGLNVRIWG